MRLISSLNSLTDEELVFRMKLGDETAFAVLYDRYWKPLYEGAGKTDWEINRKAKDVVQDIMESIWIRKDKLTTQNHSLGPYLFTLLKYKVINTLAYTQRQEVCYHTFGQVLALQENNTLEGLISRELQEAIDREIEAMPANMRKVIQLRKQQDRSIAEIANSLSLTEQTVRNLLSQAIRRLKVRVAQFYGDAPSHAHIVFLATAITLLES
ncbi:MAG: sigma-70 family RNA polymerase sigma factor [Leadbetterella sp.]|nr:sigma-70 family RNA polymerase sigma factor [Leadbetterella sp.]